MNEEQAIKAIKNVRNSGIIITLFFIILPILLIFILPPDSIELSFTMYIIVTELIMLGILNGLVLGVYKFKSRVCAIALFLGTILMIVAGISTNGRFPLLIYLILLYIYYKGIRATFYLHNNKVVNY